jgi:uncharacterized cupredoxin-like copper-binding protein
MSTTERDRTAATVTVTFQPFPKERHMSRRRNILLGSALALPATALVIAGCGGGNGSQVSASPPAASNAVAPSGHGQTLHLTANPSGKLEFSPMQLSAKAGKVSLVMKNPSSSGLQHGVAVEGNGVDKDGKIVGPGGTSTVTVNLKKGKYEFYCPFDGHKAAGMTGTLTVR